MAKNKGGGASGQTGTPGSGPISTPQELYATSDIRFVMLEIGKLTSTTQRLVDDVEKLTDKIGTLTTSADRFRTGFYVVAGIVTLILAPVVAFLWSNRHAIAKVILGN